MAHPDTEHRREAPARHAAKASTETRIDASHGASKPEDTPSGGNPDTTKAPVPSDVAEQRLRAQAEQLATELRTRQKELDHREAQINSQMAQLDRDSRTARLWLAEREAELDQRGEELVRREREVEARLAAAAQRSQAGTKEAEIDRREAALVHEVQQIDARREASLQLARQMLAGLERRREALEVRGQQLDEQQEKSTRELIAREEVLRRTAEGLAARQRELDQAEGGLADAHAEVQQLREQLLADRREAQEEGRLERQKAAAEHCRVMDDLERKRQAVQRRAEHVDQCRLALQQLRAELGRMHRETLEIRLATEELWVQLSGAAPPAALTRSLGRIRTKLADHYRRANAELQSQKMELENIRSQLAEQYEKVVHQKRQLEQWSAAQHQEAEQQAARLIAREEQLRQQEVELEDRAHLWQAERLEYQHEIRRLQARLPRPSEAAIPA